MFVIILALALHPGKQLIYTADGPEAIRFSTYAECAARAQSEVQRLTHSKDVKGEFMLYCVPEAALQK